MAVFSNLPNNENSKAAGISVLASGAKIVGSLVSDGVVKVEGTVDGTVSCSAQVFIGQSGLVEGDIHALEVVVGGRVRGSIVANGRVEMQPGSAVYGDVSTPKLTIQEGGEVNGKIAMSPQPAPMIGSDGPIAIDPDKVRVATPHGPPTQRIRKDNRAVV